MTAVSLPLSNRPPPFAFVNALICASAVPRMDRSPPARSVARPMSVLTRCWASFSAYFLSAETRRPTLLPLTSVLATTLSYAETFSAPPASMEAPSATSASVRV